jgi:hypothetical protein
LSFILLNDSHSFPYREVLKPKDKTLSPSSQRFTSVQFTTSRPTVGVKRVAERSEATSLATRCWAAIHESICPTFIPTPTANGNETPPDKVQQGAGRGFYVELFS